MPGGRPREGSIHSPHAQAEGRSVQTAWQKYNAQQSIPLQRGYLQSADRKSAHCSRVSDGRRMKCSGS